MSETLYIQIGRNIQMKKRDVTIGDVADIFCKDKNISARVKTIKLIKIDDVPKKRICFSIMRVIQLINEIYPDVEVNNMGECDFVVDYIKQKKKNPWMNYLLVGAVSLLVFVGSAYAIIAYNNDVSTNEIFEKIYEMFETPELASAKIIEIAYAVGLALGIIVFYNHFAGRNITSDPTPIEVEMDKYEADIDTALIDRASADERKCSVK